MSEEKIIDIFGKDILDPSQIIDNKNYFTHDNKSYRCIMPCPADLAKAEDIKNAVYGKLLNTDGYHLLDNLKKILKEKQNVDIDDLEEKKKKIIKRIYEHYLYLAPLGESEKLKVIDETLDKIEELKEEYVEVNGTIEKFLHPSIERQMEAKWIEHLTFSCTEVLEKGETEKYTRVWSDKEVFDNDRTMLSNLAIRMMGELVLDSRTLL